MLCLNFDFYIIPLTLLLTFLKQYVMCMLLAERNVNPEEQVHLISFLKSILLTCYFTFSCGLIVFCHRKVHQWTTKKTTTMKRKRKERKGSVEYKISMFVTFPRDALKHSFILGCFLTGQGKEF